MGEARATALNDWHRECGGRLVTFAGWTLPLQYGGGIIAEHDACRTACALFDVSHMGTVLIPGDPQAAAQALEQVIAGDLQAQRPGTAKYALMLAENGGIVDDLMALRHENAWYLVVNAARTTDDLAYLEGVMPPAHRPVLLRDQSLLALQGPAAEDVLAAHLPEVRALRFRQSIEVFIDGQRARVARIGYTGEDGFEIALPDSVVGAFATHLAADGRVTPAGLGARDSLRLEAGLCLYGHDIDLRTTPVVAGLAWTINKRRREAADFPGAERILQELASGPSETLVGIRLEGRLPAREGAVIHAGDAVVGRVTSGGFGPTVGAPVALGYVTADVAAPGTPLTLQVRRHAVAGVVTALPFVPHHYQR